MSNIESIVDSLENRVSKVLENLNTLKEANEYLAEELKLAQQKTVQQDTVINSWKGKYESLKLANSILGSEESKRDAKLKINKLIREIDHCISQLSE